MTPTAATLLHAWESGTAVAPLDRAPTLLHSLDVLPTNVRTDELTVGQCDARLFELRRAMFGEMLELVTTCPACHTDIELTVALGALQPQVDDGPARPRLLEADGYTVLCRPPGNEDLRALACIGDAVTPRDLLERCALEVTSPDGTSVAPQQLPEVTAEAILDALADGDPGARTALQVHCPCANQWVDELDIRTVLWSDLTEWVGRTLTEVHRLAQAYGWSEAEILAMSSWRRRWYLEALGW